MIERIGKVADGVYMLGHHAVPIFLVDGERPALFDAGMSFLGPNYADQIRQTLKGRQPEWCFLTHSHWDHCGAVTYLKGQFPRMKVVCSAKAAEIFSRPGAISLIADLNRFSVGMAADLGVEAKETPFEPFPVDVMAKEGDRFELAPDLTVHVLETPGHTWDFLSYFIPQRKLLVASEALGTRDQTGAIINDCLVDYDAYCRSMERLNALEADILLLGHICSFTGQEARRHITASLEQIRRFKRMVEDLMTEENGELDAVMTRIKAMEWDGNPGIRQPEPAYRLNLSARINTVLQKGRRREVQQNRIHNGGA